MSTPFLKFSCDKCSFQGSSPVTFRRFLWSHRGHLFQFYRQLGLCLDCDEIVAMENFPFVKTLKRAKMVRKDYKGKPLSFFFEKDYGMSTLKRDMQIWI